MLFSPPSERPLSLRPRDPVSRRPIHERHIPVKCVPQLEVFRSLRSYFVVSGLVAVQRWRRQRRPPRRVSQLTTPSGADLTSRCETDPQMEFYDFQLPRKQSFD